MATRIATALSASGNKVWFDKVEVREGDSLAAKIDKALAASDYVVVLLSRHSVQSQWVQHELAAAYGLEIDTRAITVVPVLLEDCDVPPPLASKQYLDLRSDTERGITTLVKQLGSATQVDFSTLTERGFSGLVADLLQALGFDVQVINGQRDRGFDIIALHHGTDPFGSKYVEKFLVECKHYRHARINLQSVQQLIGAVDHEPADTTGLLVTTGQITSPVRQWVAGAVRRGARLRLIDGTEVKRLLLRFPDVARKHLAKTP